MARLLGYNLGGWFSQVDCIEEKDPETFLGNEKHYESFITERELDWIALSGANHVRLPVDYFNLFDLQTLEPQMRVLELLDEKILQIRKRGLKVIFDLHKCPGHDFHLGSTQDQPFFTDHRCREDALSIWAFLAERYGKDRGILLEILNEPVAVHNEQWNKVVMEFWELIRKFAPENTIVIGSNKWNHPSTFPELVRVPDANVLYSFHMYEPLLFTHQRATWIDDVNFHQSTTFPGTYHVLHESKNRLPLHLGKWDESRMREFLKPVLDFRDQTKHSVACNEFGVFLRADRESQLHWIETLLCIFREYEIGYSYWNFKNLDFGIHSVGEVLHENLPQYQNPDRLDRELLDILSRG